MKAEYIVINNKEKTIFSDKYFTRYWKRYPGMQRIDFNNELNGIVQNKEQTFFRYENFDKDIDVALVGIGYCGGSLKKSSSVEEFPDFLRKQSYGFRAFYNFIKGGSSGVYDLDTKRILFEGLKFVDLGNLSGKFSDYKELGNSISKLIRWNKHKKSSLISIGGDHSITYHLITEICSILEKPIIVLIFDAHQDAKYGLFTSKQINHANFVYSLLNNENVEKIIQVGTRGIRSISNYIQHKKLLQISPMNLNEYYYKITSYTNKNMYISIDLDVLNSSQFPNVDYAITGGLSVYQLQSCLSFLKQQKINIVGGDLVEGLPYSEGEYSSTALKILSLMMDCMCRENIRGDEKLYE